MLPQFYGLISDIHYNTEYRYTLIIRQLPNTLFLTIPSLTIAIFLAIVIGKRTAYSPNYFFAKTISILTGIGMCTPAFFTALFLIKIFAFDIPLFPISGMKDISKSGTALALSKVYHAVLPITVLTLMQYAPLIRYVQSFMQSVKDEKFIRTYEGFGMLYYAAYKKEAFKVIIPRLTAMIRIEVPSLISGALITETIFVWHGIGKLNFDAVHFRDYPLLIGITAITALCVLIANLISDILNY